MPATNGVNLHVHINAPATHDNFHPLHKESVSPGHTPYYPQSWPPRIEGPAGSAPHSESGTSTNMPAQPQDHAPQNGSMPARPRTSRGRRPADNNTEHLNGVALCAGQTRGNPLTDRVCLFQITVIQNVHVHRCSSIVELLPCWHLSVTQWLVIQTWALLYLSH